MCRCLIHKYFIYCTHHTASDLVCVRVCLYARVSARVRNFSRSCPPRTHPHVVPRRLKTSVRCTFLYHTPTHTISRECMSRCLIHKYFMCCTHHAARDRVCVQSVCAFLYARVCVCLRAVVSTAHTPTYTWCPHRLNECKNYTYVSDTDTLIIARMYVSVSDT